MPPSACSLLCAGRLIQGLSAGVEVGGVSCTCRCGSFTRSEPTVRHEREEVYRRVPAEVYPSARAFTARNHVRRSTALPMRMTRQYLRNARRESGSVVRTRVMVVTRDPVPSGST